MTGRSRIPGRLRMSARLASHLAQYLESGLPHHTVEHYFPRVVEDFLADHLGVHVEIPQWMSDYEIYYTGPNRHYNQALRVDPHAHVREEAELVTNWVENIRRIMEQVGHQGGRPEEMFVSPRNYQALRQAVGRSDRARSNLSSAEVPMPKQDPALMLDASDPNEKKVTKKPKREARPDSINFHGMDIYASENTEDGVAYLVQSQVRMQSPSFQAVVNRISDEVLVNPHQAMWEAHQRGGQPGNSGIWPEDDSDELDYDSDDAGYEQ